MKLQAILLTTILFAATQLLEAQNKNGEPARTKYKSYKSDYPYPKSAKAWMKGMLFIPGGSFTMNKVSEVPKITERDSFLLATQGKEKKVAVAAFFMGQAEVTNQAYRAFYEDMVKEKGKAAAEIYKPDTLSWQKEFHTAFNEPMVNHYFTHPAYDHYPVVGVSWEQANAYCKWLTKNMNEDLAARGEVPMPEFRLPTEAEWECAAVGLQIGDALQNLYGWEGHALYDKKRQFQANFGPIIDQNGLMFKDYGDDLGMYTASVYSYLPNNFGLYNMSGNVSEWVADLLTEEDAGSADARVLKGGSWVDGPFYLQIGARQALSQKRSSCRVGFRVAMSFLDRTETLDAR